MNVARLSAHPRYRSQLEQPLTRNQLQKRIARGKSTIFAWEAEGMPVFVRAAGGNLYLESDVLAWLRETKAWNYSDKRTHTPSPRGQAT